MARVNVNPDSLKRRAPEDGIYPVILDTVEIQKLKSGEGNKVYWVCRITDKCEDPQLIGTNLFIHTSLEPGKGDRYLKLVNGLKFDPANFDTDDAQGLECFARVKKSIRKNSITGEMEEQSDVLELLRD